MRNATEIENVKAYYTSVKEMKTTIIKVKWRGPTADQAKSKKEGEMFFYRVNLYCINLILQPQGTILFPQVAWVMC